MLLLISMNPFHQLLVLVTLLLQILSSPASHSTEGLTVVERTRLGSTPPSCHNKCNECHPCFAVQVPTLPSHDRLAPSLTRVKPSASSIPKLMDYSDFPGNRYSNYKPLGWKCRCNNHFYNP